MLKNARTGQDLKVTGFPQAEFRSQLLGKNLQVERFKVEGFGQIGLFKVADKVTGGFNEFNTPDLLTETRGRRLTTPELKELLETGALGTTLPSTRSLLLRSSDVLRQNHRDTIVAEMEMVLGKPTVRFEVNGDRTAVSFEEQAKTWQLPSLESFSFVSPGLGRASNASSGSLIVLKADHEDVSSAALANEIHQHGRVTHLYLVSAKRELPALIQLPENWEPPPGGITRYSLKEC